jgi:hypothetical protein
VLMVCDRKIGLEVGKWRKRAEEVVEALMRMVREWELACVDGMKEGGMVEAYRLLHLPAPQPPPEPRGLVAHHARLVTGRRRVV